MKLKKAFKTVTVFLFLVIIVSSVVFYASSVILFSDEEKPPILLKGWFSEHDKNWMCDCSQEYFRYDCFCLIPQQ